MRGTMTAEQAAKLERLEAIAEAADTLAAAIRAFRESPGRRRALRDARAAERRLKLAMRAAGKSAVRVDGTLYVDIYAHHVADADGEGLWDLAVIPPGAGIN